MYGNSGHAVPNADTNSHANAGSNVDSDFVAGSDADAYTDSDADTFAGLGIAVSEQPRVHRNGIVVSAKYRRVANELRRRVHRYDNNV